jgi:hypothetical protein
MKRMYSYFILKVKYPFDRLQIIVVGGPRKVVSRWSQDQALYESWREGRTGFVTTPLVCFLTSGAIIHHAY